MKVLYLLQGIPGGGKSTLACALSQTVVGSEILSTDDFWYLRDPNVYDYDSDKLGLAHDWNQMRCKAAMRDEAPVIIIDNTNIKQRAAQPYLDMAKQFGYLPIVVRVEVDPAVAKMRQRQRFEDRRVPDEAIDRMYSQMERIVV